MKVTQAQIKEVFVTGRPIVCPGGKKGTALEIKNAGGAKFLRYINEAGRIKQEPLDPFIRLNVSI